MDDATQKWIAQNRRVCTCLGMTRKVIDTAIADGATSVEEVKKRTGAGRGSCGGKGCGPRIKKILENPTSYSE